MNIKVTHFVLLYGFVSSESKSCSDPNGKSCKFPFIYKDVTYNGCTWWENHRTKGLPWCSTKLNSNGTHKNSDDGSTWMHCSSECPIAELKCFTPPEECRNIYKVLKICNEVIDNQVAAQWCVRKFETGANYLPCSDICKVEVDKAGFLPFGICSESSSECEVYFLTFVVLLIGLLSSLAAIYLMISRNNNIKLRNSYDMKIHRKTINVGDVVRESMVTPVPVET